MRLIDADKLIEKLRNFKELENDEGNPIHTMSELQRIYKCINFVQEQPTAYNVDKVLEQMEDATAIGADCVGNAFECIPKYMAIEIVKAGGKIYGKAD